MSDYRVVFSKEAERDIDNLTDIIKYKYKAPITAFNYVQGLLNEIFTLSKFPEVYAEKSYLAFSHYADKIRRINYKRMAIIYTVQDKTVFIHRIIPASMISGL